MNLDTDTSKPILSRPDPDFVPFACHYDEETLLTKAGNLVQSIKLTSLENENIIAQTAIIREMIRDAIKYSVKSNDIAIWIHTVRTKRDVRLKGKYKVDFASKMNETWNAENNWDGEYVNDIYISIVLKGFDVKIASIDNLVNSFFFSYIKHKKAKFFKEQKNVFDELQKNILEVLESYGAQVLRVHEKEGVYYSEPLAFMSRLINFKEKEFPLKLSDISDDLIDSDFAFGGNTAVMKNDRDTRYFSMFSVKEYSEISSKILDKILQLPQELIITQTVLFTNDKEAMKAYERQEYISRVSEDDNLAYITGLDKITAMNKGDVTDFIKSQITFNISGESKEKLEENVTQLYNTFKDLGILTVREDLALEQCYWAQIPGNFSFINREQYYPTSILGGFASLQSFPIGKPTGFVWPEAVTIFRTAVNTPYFFNFHDKDGNGNTLILGPRRSGKSKLMNFLLSESLKFVSRIFYIDHDRSGKIFIRAIGGRYYKIKKNYDAQNRLRLNPFLLENTQDNVDFLLEWVLHLTSHDKTDMTLLGEEDSIIDKETEKLLHLIEKYLSEQKEGKQLSDFVQLLEKEGLTNIPSRLKPWCDKKKYASIFDNERETDFTKGIVGFDISAVSKNPMLLSSVLLYLTHKIQTVANDSNTIVAMDSAWKMFNYPIMGPWLVDWLHSLVGTKTFAVLTGDGEKNLKENYIDEIEGCFGTHMYMGREFVSDEMKDVFGISKQEERVLTVMNRSDYAFILKNSDDVIVTSSKLQRLKDSLDILISTPQTINFMQEAIQEGGRESSEWIPLFYNKIAQYKKEQEEKAKARRKAAKRRFKKEGDENIMMQ